MATPPKPTPAQHQAQHQEAPAKREEAPAKRESPAKHEEAPAKRESPPRPAKRESAGRADAAALFKNGHRIAKVGDPRDQWISMGRLSDGTAVHQMPMTDALLEEIEGGQYYLAEGPEEEEGTAPPAGPPTVVDAPYIEQNADLMSCTQGNWLNEPTSYAYQWRRDGATNIGTGSPQYVIVGADVGKTLDCVLTASNSGGSATATSNGVVVSAPAKK